MAINTEVFKQFPTLNSNRLTLREIKVTDAAEIYEMRANGRVNQFIAREKMDNLESAVKLIEKTALAYQNQQGIGWAGVLRDNDRIVGTCGFNYIDYPNHRAEIGGELSVEYWGKGIALEAVETIIKFGFEILNLHSIEAKVSPGNRGAIFLLEKTGFKKEAHFTDRVFHKGGYSDMAVFSLIKGNKNYNP
jgi:[ribosomal protein S5]-alanine N-acetyltransferase